MGPGLTSIFITAGGATWIYTQLQKRNGNNTKQSAIATAIAAVFIFIVAISITTLILK